MNRCKTCKHWQKNDRDYRDDDIFKPFDPDTFEPMELTFEVRYCKSPHVLFYERPIETKQVCMVDGSNYRAELITGPDFGCVNHEAAPNE